MAQQDADRPMRGGVRDDRHCIPTTKLPRPEVQVVRAAAAAKRLLMARLAAPEPDRYGDARSGHGAFCTATYIELQRADCWLKLGCPQRAVATYEKALADLPAAYNRDRGYGLAQFGSALVATNELEHAASVTREALGIARGCGSGRTMQRIRAVGGSLRPHAKLPSVARLLDELAAVG